MSDVEKARAQAEAKSSAPAMSSADRARFWAGLNCYLAAEAHHARSTTVPDEKSTELSPSGLGRTPETKEPADSDDGGNREQHGE